MGVHLEGARVSVTMAAKATGFAQSISGPFVSDEIVKAALASCIFKCMEIASYCILIAAAKQVATPRPGAFVKRFWRRRKPWPLAWRNVCPR